MVAHTGAHPELLWPGIKSIFGDSYDNWPTEWTKLVDVVDSDKQFEKYQGLTNFGLAGVKDQGAGIPYRDRFSGFPREIANIFYGIGTTITYEMMRFDQYGKFRDLPAKLAESVRKTEETVVANLLNNGFSTTLTADGLSLLNASHLLVADSATQRNTPSTASDLSQSALEQMYIDIDNWVDDNNLPLMAKAIRLIVPSESRFLAMKILETEFKVDSGDNTINPVSSARMPLDLVVSHYLTDTDAWFIKTNIKEGLVFQEVDPVSTDRDNEFDTKNLKFSAMRGFGVGAVNYNGYYGSPGA
jgi:hypothetical protein